MPVKIGNTLWLIALLVLAAFGVTLSWSMLTVMTLSVTLVTLVSATLYKETISCRPSKTDGLFLLGIFYFGWRALDSEVFDLSKEDLLLILIGSCTYFSFRSFRGSVAVVFGGIIVILSNLCYFVLQKNNIEAVVPMALVSEVAQVSSNFGMFQDYGALGSSMAIMGVFLICYALGTETPRAISWVAFVVGLAAFGMVFFCGSRSAALSVVVGSVLLMIVSWIDYGNRGSVIRKKRRIILGMLGLLVIPLLIFLATSTFVGRDSKWATSGVVTDSNIREGYWGMAIDQWREAPFVGTGARSYSYKSAEHWDGSLESGDASPEFVHNEYLQVVADYGILGILIFLAVIGIHWGVALRSILVSTETSRYMWMRMAGLIGLTVVMVHSLTDFPLRVPFNMVLAAVCLAWCVPRKSSEDKEKRVKVSLCVMVMLFFSAAVVFAGREIWAAVPLLEMRQTREDGSWSPVGHDSLLSAYELSNKRSPDFRRSQRIGQIYHSRYVKGNDAAFDKAAKYYKESLDRHPYNPVSMLNLAHLYRDRGEYKDSTAYYKLAEPYVSARDWHFKYYLERSELSIYLAEKSYCDGSAASAMKHLDEAIGLLKKCAPIWGNGRFRLRDCRVSKLCLVLESREYKCADSLWKEIQSQTEPWVLRRRGSNSYYKLGEAYCDAASKEWRMRKPELAKELYLKSKWFYLNDKSVRKGLTDVERDTKLEFVEQALRTLEEGGF